MKVSIITINYNNSAGLKRTLASVDGQSYHNYELVIVDGGSHDYSRTIIEEYAKEHPSTRYVSEPDKGIYNAMNKGTRMSSGDYCIFMNSGDCFNDKTSLSDTLPYLDGKIDIVTGGTRSDVFKREAPKLEDLSLAFFIKEAMNHQSTFIKRQLLLDCPYNENRRIAGDSEFFFQTMILKNASYKQIPVCVSYCEAAGESGNLEKSIEERFVAIKELLPPRMGYDVDFIGKYHNPIIIKIGDFLYKKWLRQLFFIYNKHKKRYWK